MTTRYLKLALGLGGLAGLNAAAQIPGKADEKIALPSFTVRQSSTAAIRPTTR